MTWLFIAFWTVMVFASIAWYAILLFLVGVKGGRDILRMARALAAQGREDEEKERERGDKATG